MRDNPLIKINIIKYADKNKPLGYLISVLIEIKNKEMLNNLRFNSDFTDFIKKDSTIEGNTFRENGNDGMDISGSVGLVIKDNTIKDADT